MTLQDELRALIAMAGSSPKAADLRAYFAPRARAITVAGPNLETPPWADAVGGAEDLFIELGGDIVGVRLYDDRRGWGTYVQMAVASGTTADVEAVTGPLSSPPRAPEDFGPLSTVAAYVETGGRTVRVFAKHQDGAVRLVTVHFQAA